jgi:hypothetical protein
MTNDIPNPNPNPSKFLYPLELEETDFLTLFDIFEGASEIVDALKRADAEKTPVAAASTENAFHYLTDTDLQRIIYSEDSILAQAAAAEISRRHLRRIVATYKAAQGHLQPDPVELRDFMNRRARG